MILIQEKDKILDDYKKATVQDVTYDGLILTDLDLQYVKLGKFMPYRPAEAHGNFKRGETVLFRILSHILKVDIEDLTENGYVKTNLSASYFPLSMISKYQPVNELANFKIGDTVLYKHGEKFQKVQIVDLTQGGLVLTSEYSSYVKLKSIRPYVSNSVNL